jgi:hypothetical protein
MAFAFAAPVLACINDAELPNHEREFRSQYNEVVSQPPAPPPAASPGPSNQALIGVGTVLLIGTAVLTLSGVRARQ